MNGRTVKIFELKLLQSLCVITRVAQEIQQSKVWFFFYLPYKLGIYNMIKCTKFAGFLLRFLNILQYYNNIIYKAFTAFKK